MKILFKKLTAQEMIERKISRYYFVAPELVNGLLVFAIIAAAGTFLLSAQGETLMAFLTNYNG